MTVKNLDTDKNPISYRLWINHFVFDHKPFGLPLQPFRFRKQLPLFDSLTMARNQDNLEFSERLQQALTRLPNKVDTPSKLAIEFNLVHHEPVTNQAVQKWLSGLSKPSRDKIETLARMCGVSVQWLRYGVAEPRSLQAPSTAQSATNKDARNRTESRLLENFRLLPQVQQELISGMAEQLAMNHRIWQIDQE